jgi:threonine synthase
MPAIVAVQGERCAPLAIAAARGDTKPARVTHEPTLAEGIAIGEPMRGEEILAHVRRHGIEVVTAPESRILEARAALAARGIYAEHTTAATYAAYLAMTEARGPLPGSLIPMCGAGLKSDKK